MDGKQDDLGKLEDCCGACGWLHDWRRLRYRDTEERPGRLSCGVVGSDAEAAVAAYRDTLDAVWLYRERHIRQSVQT